MHHQLQVPKERGRSSLGDASIIESQRAQSRLLASLKQPSNAKSIHGIRGKTIDI